MTREGLAQTLFNRFKMPEYYGLTILYYGGAGKPQAASGKLVCIHNGKQFF